MSDTIDIEPQVGEDVFRAWVLDDLPSEADQVAKSVATAGLIPECISLSHLNERIGNVIAAEERAPDVALIDLQWMIYQRSVRLGNSDVPVDDKSRFGLRIAEHLRTLDQFRRCTIAIATQFPDRDIHGALDELGMAVLVPKRLIQQLPVIVEKQSERGSQAGREALARIGLKIFPRSERGANPRLLEVEARALGLEHELAKLAGASRSEVDIALLLANSRDARERVILVSKIAFHLAQIFAEPVPDADEAGRQLGIPLRRVLLEGSQLDLQRILWGLQDRGGGGADVRD